MRSPPSGTVTFLFSDIEGSTRLLDALGRERYGETLRQHQRLLRQAWQRHRGFEVDTEGDAFFVAFAQATDALAAAADAQRALAVAAWPQGHELRVRIGIHSGEAAVAGENYVGMAVHRAARIAAAAHGGQVLVSETTRALCADEQLPGAGLRDLGLHRLKDLTQPQRLFQLVADGLRPDFPPPRTLENRPTNLPSQPTPLIGRGRELDELRALLARADVRLITVTGPGGTGKTRLAMQLGADLIEDFPQGVFFVNLAPLTLPELVLATVAQTLGVREQPALPLEQTLTEHLRDQRILIILDNFEQLVEAAPRIAMLLRETDELKLVTTSRFRLQLAAEHEYPVPPLDDAESIALFAERAQAAKPSFSLNGNRPIVAEICARLDHLPLAIELAAARVKMLPERALLERLSERLKLLTGGARDLDERQRTLRAAIDWSHNLLSDDEQTMFRRLAVFVGGCRIDAVEAVCNADGSLDVLELVGSLLDKSLLRQQETRDGEPRFSMLETIDEYARERLEASVEFDDLRTRHADYFLALAEELFDDWAEARSPSGYTRSLEEQENFRTAMAWLVEHRGADSLRLVLRLWRAWFGRGQLDEAERWVQAALEAGHDAPPRPRAMMQGILGEFPRFRGEHERAIELKEAALSAARKIGDQRNVKALLCDMADSFAAIGELGRADELAAEALAIEEGAGDPRQSRALATAAELAMLRNDYTEALRRYEQILEIIRPYQEEETSSYVWVMGCLGECFRKIGHEQNAIAAFREGIRAALDSRILTWLHYVLQGVAALAEPTEPYRGAVTLAASEATRSSMGLADDVGEYPKIESPLRARLGPSDFDAAYAEGAAQSIDEAAAYALETLDAISRHAVTPAS